MTPQETIELILKSNRIESIFPVDDQFDKKYTSIIAQIHPDKVGDIPGASDATAKLNGWRDLYYDGKLYKDEITTFKTNGYWAKFIPPVDNIAQFEWSFENMNLFHEE